MADATPSPWSLDPRLEADSLFVADLPLCHLRLQDDARWPWLVLIPRGPNLVEIEHLDAAGRALLLEEVVQAGRAVRALGAALGAPVEKLNVGALGNVVRQLHVHVIGRRTGDPAGAAPVWGAGTAERYTSEAAALAVATTRSALGG